MNYEPIGYCIYCFTNHLSPKQSRFSDEHIVPLALNGALVLPEASCNACAHIINKEIENKLMREYRYFRAYHGIRRRHNNKSRPKSVVVENAFKNSLSTIPISEYSCPIMFYKFHAPRLLSGEAVVPNSHAWIAGPVLTVDKNLHKGEVAKIKAVPYEFARFIAKIGYGYAVAEVGLSCFRPLVNDIILGHSEDYFRFIGCKDSTSPDGGWPEGGQHSLSISFLFTSSHTAWVIVSIKLFGSAPIPVYQAVVGEVDLKVRHQFEAWEKHRLNGKLKTLHPSVKLTSG